jgi:16S rRNA (cytidine1402-2'-O)-methyltransferase
LSGRLLIVSTPIGNLGDITPRVKDALSQSSLVLAEDTRVTQKLLFHLGIKTTMLSCHEHNEKQRLTALDKAAKENAVVSLVCDAGTPLLSDPGYQMVRRAIDLDMQISPIPGPSSVLAALVASGLPGERFSFEGFLPDKAGDRKKRLHYCRADDRTLIFFVAPSNLLSYLREVQAVLGDRQACLARELTKLYEQFVRGSLSEIAAHVSEKGVKGECVLVVAGASDKREKLDADGVSSRLSQLLSRGVRLKEACSLLAAETGWSASEIYSLGLSLKEQ